MIVQYRMQGTLLMEIVQKESDAPHIGEKLRLFHDTEKIHTEYYVQDILHVWLVGTDVPHRIHSEASLEPLDRETMVISLAVVEKHENPQEPFTICYACVHFLNVSGGFNSDIWYNHLCKAYPINGQFDYVTGKVGTAEKEKFSYCRDRNDGNCPKYEAKIRMEVKGLHDES